MLTKLSVFSSWSAAPTVPFLELGSAETDLIQIRSIEGLDPVKASVNTISYGSVDGSSHIGDNIDKRNIVFTLHPNPDWDVFTPSVLRQRLYAYFMPKIPVKLVFESDDIVPIEISGIVEGISNNMFSRDLEFQVSIICPDPHFKAVEESVISGSAIRTGGSPTLITYNGNKETGFNLKLNYISGSIPSFIGVQIANANMFYFAVEASVDSTKYFELNTLPLRKYVQTVRLSDGIITNLLANSQLIQGKNWPTLQPKANEFSVITDVGVQNWTLKYFERFGGL